MFQSKNKLFVILIFFFVTSLVSPNHLRHHHALTLWDNIPDEFKNVVQDSENKIYDPASEIPGETSSSSENESNNENDDFDKFHKSHSTHKDESGKNCKTCQNGVKMTEEELTALRIEFVKNQILKKLRLTERPNVSIKDLPKPITEKLVPFPETENVNRQVEDYYGKTTKKFIFLQEGEI